MRAGQHAFGEVRGPTAPRSCECVVNFAILGGLAEIETIARGNGIRDLPRLIRIYGRGHWRKRKGVARVRLSTGRIRLAELPWYEAHGIGRKVQSKTLS